MSADPQRLNLQEERVNRLADSLREVVTANEERRRRRGELGADKQALFIQALGAAAKQISRRKLTTEESRELAGLESKHAEKQRELGRALVELPVEIASPAGLLEQRTELLQTQQQLAETRAAQANTSHRWRSFTSLPSRAQKGMIGIAGLLVLCLLGGLAFASRDARSGLRAAFFKNSQLETTLLGLSPSWGAKLDPSISVEVQGESDYAVESEEVISFVLATTSQRVEASELQYRWLVNGEEKPDLLRGDDRGATFTAPVLPEPPDLQITVQVTGPDDRLLAQSSPLRVTVKPREDIPMVERWPLVRKGESLAFYRADKTGPPLLGFVFDNDRGSEVQFRCATADGSIDERKIPREQIQVITKNLGIGSNDRYDWVGRLVSQTVNRMLLPNATCVISDPDQVRSVEITSITSNDDVSKGDLFHVVRVMERREGEQGPLSLQYREVGTATVEVASNFKIELTAQGDLTFQEGDWVFPVHRSDTQKQLVFDGIADPFEEPTATSVDVDDEHKRHIRTELERLSSEVGGYLTGVLRIKTLNRAGNANVGDLQLVVDAELTSGGRVALLNTKLARIDKTSPMLQSVAIATLGSFDYAMLEPDSTSPLPERDFSGKYATFVSMDGNQRREFGLIDQTADLNTLLGQQQPIAFRPLFDLPKAIAVDDRLPGSFEALEEDECFRRLPPSQVIAFEVARKVFASATGDRTRPKTAPLVMLRNADIDAQKQLIEHRTGYLSLGNFWEVVRTQREFVGTDVGWFLAFERWSKNLRSDVARELSKVGVPLQLDNGADYVELAPAYYSAASAEGVTHILVTELSFDLRQGQATALTTLKELRPDPVNKKLVTALDTPLPPLTISAEDVYRTDETYASPLPLIGDGPLVRIHLVPTKVPGGLRGGGFKIVQLIDANSDPIIYRELDSLEPTRVAKDAIKEIETLPLKSLTSKDDAVLSAAYSAAAALYTNSGKVKGVRGSESAVDLGPSDGVASGTYLMVTKTGEDDLFSGTSGIIKVTVFNDKYRLWKALVPADMTVAMDDIVFPYERKRVHLVVYPPTVDPAASPGAKNVWSGRSRSLAEDISMCINADFQIPLVASVEDLYRISQELARPGSDPFSSEDIGKRIGATHVLMGTLYPKPGQENLAELKLRLLDVKTGQERRLPEASVMIHWKQ